MHKQQRNRHARAFSLIELLVVIAIIAIVVAIIVPAMGGARTAARKAATGQLLTDVSNAAMQFSQDHAGNMPGYFLPSEMGSDVNIDASRGGFTAMENALLDLIGQDAIVGKAGLSGGGAANGKLIGPFGNVGNSGKGGRANVRVDLDLLGKGDRVYLPGVAQNLAPADGQEASTPHKEFPDIIDAFGNPVLAWVEDPTAPREPTSMDEFARDTSKGDSARFYWASNSAWLTSSALGRGGKDQTDANAGSLLYERGEATDSLSAVLGNPNFPIPIDFRASDVRPGSARGAFVVHSAGADGVYFGRRDPGARSLGVGDDPLEYASTFFPKQSGGNWGPRLKDASGKIYSVDITKEFDDLLTASGN